MSAAACAHVGQRRLQGGHGPEHVDLELPPYLGQWGFLEGSFQAVAGVGDDDVQGTDAALDLRDHAGDGITVGHVQDAAVSVPGPEFLEGLQILFGADGADHGVPGGQGGLRESAPQARAHAGDEPVLLLHCSSSKSCEEPSRPSSESLHSVDFFRYYVDTGEDRRTGWVPKVLHVPRIARIGAFKVQHSGCRPGWRRIRSDLPHGEDPLAMTRPTCEVRRLGSLLAAHRAGGAQVLGVVVDACRQAGGL